MSRWGEGSKLPKTALLASFTELFGEEPDTFEVTRIDRGYNLKFGAMYESPELTTARLMALCDMFGTRKIDVDRYSEGGCETCDWGSDYGHELQIREATLRVDELEALVARPKGASDAR